MPDGHRRGRFYDRRVLPWLIDVAMRNEESTRHRKRAIPAARGRVLELGVGSGLNLPFYGPAVERLFALDPSAELLRMAQRRRARAGLPVTWLEASAQAVPLPDRSVDTVVSTWTLCSIPDAAQALAEATRVLAPDGVLLFVEHGHAPDATVARWQRRINPLWRRVAGGCNLDRRIDRLLQGAGFELLELETGYVKGPRPFTYTYSGRARRA